MYTVDMDANKLLHLEPRTWDFISRLEPKVGVVEHMLSKKDTGDLISMLHGRKKTHEATLSREKDNDHNAGSRRHCTSNSVKVPKIAVVGSGPSGLFASLVLAELGADVTLVERGQPVEQRGRDIGALIVRRILQLDSNFCFGEVPGVMENW